MLTFLLLFIIIFFIIVPLGKIGLQIYRTRKQFRDLYDSFRSGRANGSSGQRSTQGYATRDPKYKKKKIDPSVGEYVAFEEIYDTTAHTGAAATDFRPEPQISDAEWEEIPDK